MWCHAPALGAVAVASTVPPEFSTCTAPPPRPNRIALPVAVSATMLCVAVADEKFAHTLIVCATFAAGRPVAPPEM